jgi:hypothetical protein
MSAILPNTRLVLAEDKKYVAIWVVMNVVHFLAFPLIIVAIVEFTSIIFRNLLSLARRLR